MKEVLLILSLSFFILMLSCNEKEKKKPKLSEAEYLAFENDLSKIDAERQAQDLRDEKKFDSLGGVIEVEIKTRGCNNYRHSYSLNKKIKNDDNLTFIANYLTYRDLDSIPKSSTCLGGQVILSIYIYEKKSDFLKDEKNFIARCIKSGIDDPYIVIKKKEERL